MIGAVNLRVAIRATAIEEKHRRLKISVWIVRYRRRPARPRRYWMLTGKMALGAEPRIRDFQQPVID